MCDLTGKLLQLVHHLVDGALEIHDLRVHFLCMDQDLLAQISHSYGSNDVANFPQGLLEGQICLLVLAQLSLEGTNVFDAMLEGEALVVELLVYLGTEVINMLALVLNLIGLLVQMVAEVVQLLLGEGCCGDVRGAIRLPRGQPVADPVGPVPRGPAGWLFSVVGIALSRSSGVGELRGGGLAGGYGEGVSVDNLGLRLEIVDAGSERSQLALDGGLFVGLGPVEDDGA